MDNWRVGELWNTQEAVPLVEKNIPLTAGEGMQIGGHTGRKSSRPL